MTLLQCTHWLSLSHDDPLLCNVAVPSRTGGVMMDLMLQLALPLMASSQAADTHMRHILGAKSCFVPHACNCMQMRAR
jgi:hypothetical protein